MQSATQIFIMQVQLTKGQPGMGTNVHWCWQLSHSLTSQGKGPHFSSFQFLSPPSLHTVSYPPRHFLRHPVLSILCGLGIFVSDAACQTDTHRAAVQMPAFEHAPSALQSTSGWLLHLVLHYSFILRTGASSEARRAGQSRSMKGPQSHFPHGPSWHRFQAARISLEYYSSPSTSLAPSHRAGGSPTTIIILYLLFPVYQVRLGRWRADWFLAG